MDKENLRSYFPVLIISTFFFFYMTGFSLNYLNPRNIDWIFFIGNEDATIAWLGWEFFRSTDLFQFPLLDNYNYGQELNISLIYTGSIPLISLILKPIQGLLGFPFQYYGIWHFICLVLHSLFAIKIINTFCSDTRLKLLLLAIALLTPLLPFNLLINHVGLFSNWVILAAIYLYIKKGFDTKSWAILLIISILIMAYLFAMILPIFIIDLLKNYVKKNLSFLKVSSILAVVFSSIIATFITMGVEIGKDTYYFYKGFGHYRMNLNSILDPSVFISNIQNEVYSFSNILPDLKDTTFNPGSGDYEGFNFLGLPILLTAMSVIFYYKKTKRNISKVDYVLPIVLGILFTLFALSNKVMLNETLIFSYPLPNEIKDFFGTFRSSGRFFWPVNYFLTFYIFYLFVKHVPLKRAIFISLTIVVIGFIDTSQIYSKTREIKSYKLNYNEPTWRLLLDDPEWINLGEKYRNIKFIYPELTPNKNTKKITLFAVSNGLSVNGGYLARIKKSSLESTIKKINYNLKICNFNNESLYIFYDKNVWEKAKSCNRNNKAIILNDIYIIAP